MAKNRGKGASNERDLCKQLSRWVSHGTREDLYWRSAMSGGRATVFKNRTGQALKSQSSDITAVDEDGMVLTRQFCIETKHLASLEWDKLIYGLKSSKMLDAWRKVQMEARDAGKLPLFIGRQNFKPAVFCLSGAGRKRFDTTGWGVSRARFPAVDMFVYMAEDVMACRFILFKPS